MEPEKVIVFDTFAPKATDALRDQEVVQLLSDDTSVGTFELSVRDDSAHDGTMDWETLQDTFEDPSIVTAPQAQKPDTVVAHHDETMDIVEAPEDELNFLDDLLLQDVDGDNPVDSVIELEAMFGDTFAQEPSIGAAAPTDQCDSVVVTAQEEEELRWDEELVSPDDFNSGLVVGVMDGATFAGIFDDGPAIVSAGPEEETPAVPATTPDDEVDWDDQLAFLDSYWYNKNLVTPWEDGGRTSIATTTAS